MHFVWIEWHLEISEAFEFYLNLIFNLAIEIYFKYPWQILDQKYERSKHDTPKTSEETMPKDWIQIWILFEFEKNGFFIKFGFLPLEKCSNVREYSPDHFGTYIPYIKYL